MLNDALHGGRSSTFAVRRGRLSVRGTRAGEDPLGRLSGLHIHRKKNENITTNSTYP